ncbi:MAG: RNA 2',3'-cyclic phosphodiesterase [Rhodothermia bacterium]|nr:RNA 2',3'-cyclic phosphodiesterase [Rhodothermia bacterium]
MIRAFAALPIPPDIAIDLIGPASQLPGDQPRWVDPATAHLTLVFLGSLTDDDVAEVGRSLTEVRQGPFDMQLATADAFPSRKSPRVVVVEPTPASELRRLYEAVCSSLAGWLPPDRRAYRPHVTLARTKGRRDIHTSNIIRTIETLLPRTIPVSEFVLYRSRTEPDRAYYDIIKTFRLGE